MNNVSTTVTIKPHEWAEVGEWMWANRENYTALSVLPHDGGTYNQAPFESITEAQYNDMVKMLHKVNVDNIVEVKDETSRQGEVACGGGACEVT